MSEIFTVACTPIQASWKISRFRQALDDLVTEHKLVTQLQELIGSSATTFPELLDAQESIQAINEV